MTTIRKSWLKGYPWEAVLAANQELCTKQSLSPQQNEMACSKAKATWEQAAGKEMTLVEALDLCRRCEELLPFVFNNGNTFATLARQMVEELAAQLPQVEAHIARTTAAHYVAGVVMRKELVQVFSHFGKAQKRSETTPIIHPLPAKPPLQSGVA